MEFFKRLFGGARSPQSQPNRDIVPQESRARADHDAAAARYYKTMSALQKAISHQQFPDAARLVRDNLKEIPAWVTATRRDFGSFDIRTIPALEQGGTILALTGDDEGLAEMRRVIAASPQLKPWAAQMEQHEKDRKLFEAILAAVKMSPGCLQTELKARMGDLDGQRIAVLTPYLERAGKIARIKAGRTLKLVPPGAPEFPAPLIQKTVESHRTDSRALLPREIDISTLDYVPLPRAPLRWQEEQAGRERAKVGEAAIAFEIRDAPWKILSIDKIPSSDRPDPAFRRTYICGDGILLIDDLGKSEGMGRVAAAVLRYDRTGKIAAKEALGRDVYRIGTHPLGHGMVALSHDCILHAYDAALKPVMETSLMTAPEVIAIRKRFAIDDDSLKNHLRCVGLSRDARRYLFTAVDEAFCVTAEGKGLWGVKLPVKEGWKRLAVPSSGYGTSAETNHALEVMGLTLPLAPDDLKRRYRDLAKQWHPDLNPANPQAGDKMKELNAAAEVLTGLDPASLPSYAGTSFVRELSRSNIKVAGVDLAITMSMQVSEIFASDWVYAAAFAGNSDAVYLAGYSGRVILLNEDGRAVRVYDIGAVPKRIIDTGFFLYILTDTRLYVLRDNALHALIDTFDGGELIVAEHGFGLLEKKRLRWHTPAGIYVGSVIAKDPIRRVYYRDDQMVVETRQQRCALGGVTAWS